MTENKKILLVAINSKYIHSNLAVYSLRAYCKDRDIHVDMIEFTINQYTDYIVRNIYESRPDVIAFSTYIWNVEYVCEVAGELRKLLPNCPIWLGGPEVTYRGREFLEEESFAKGIMTGEGEETFYQLAKIYNLGNGSDEELAKMLGISFRKEDGTIVTNAPMPLLSMDEIPFVYNDLSEFENKIIYYESSRGCPYGCSYCLSSIDKSVRFRSTKLVFAELKIFLDNKVSQVKFVDRTFNCNHKRTLELLEFLRDNDNGITNFHFEIAADLINEEEIKVLSQLRPGLVQLEIGVQSTNTDTIKEIDRIMDFKHVSYVVNKINEGHNVHQHLDLIAGLPYEDYTSFMKSFDDVYRLRPEQLQLGFLKVLSGSKMGVKAKEYGAVFTTKPPYEVLYTDWLGYEDVLKLKDIEEVVELYYNSGQYSNTMDRLLRFFDRPAAMYEALADYYRSEGLFDLKHTRITRYNILREFIDKYVTEPADAYIMRQILLYDLFLRENLKTRPEFAMKLDEYKDDIRALYRAGGIKDGSGRHIEPFDIEVLDIIAGLPDGRYSLKNYDRETKDAKIAYVLFNYDDRDPLNYDASATVISVQIL